MGEGPVGNIEPRGGDEATDAVGVLLEQWQATADPERLATLVAVVRPHIEAVAVRTLARCDVADRSASDDVVSLVLDHLRRLPRGLDGERQVAMFRGADPAAGCGLAYIRLLARNRARDVARSRLRRERHARIFSMLDAEAHRSVSGGGAAAAAMHDRLMEAVGRLEPPLRTVVELLLEGKSQAVIAHVLDVCEGTVSRMRSRAVARLRELLDA